MLLSLLYVLLSLFFFNDTATTEIYTLSLHDALPISECTFAVARQDKQCCCAHAGLTGGRSEEHTSELQSRRDLVCRLLLEKKKKKKQARNDEKSARTGESDAIAQRARYAGRLRLTDA